MLVFHIGALHVWEKKTRAQTRNSKPCRERREVDKHEYLTHGVNTIL